MKFKILFIATLLFYCLCGHSQETGFPIIRNYSPKEFRNQPQVFGITQDKRGVIYFGCGDILEYDGISWRIISLPQNAYVHELEADNTGKRIYVTANGEFGYLSADLKGNNIYHSLKPLINNDTLKFGYVWTLRQTSEFVYFHSYEAIFQYSPTDEKIKVFLPEKNDEFLNGFVYHDTYYVRLYKKGLVKIENQQMVPANQSAFFVNENAFKVAQPFNKSTMLIATRGQNLLLYKPEIDSLPIPFSLSKPEFLKDNYIYSNTSLDNNYLMLGSINAGAILFDKQGKVLQQYNENKLLQNNTVYYMSKDNFQNVWMALDIGISKIRSGLDWSFWNKHSGLNGIVMNVFRFKKRLYIATSTNVYYIDERNNIKEITNGTVGQNWCFFNWNNGQSLLAGNQDGLYEINEENAKLIYKCSQVYKISQSIKDPDRIYVNHYPNMISLKHENGKWVNEGIWEGIEDEVRGIIEEENGTIWLGTYQNGVIKITPVSNSENTTGTQGQKVYTNPFGMKYTVKYYTQKEGFVSLLEILPFKIKDQIVFGTKSGLYAYNKQTDRFGPYSNLGKQFCIGSRDVFLLQEMSDGRIWICPKENSKADIGYLQPNKNGGYNWIFAPFRYMPEMSIEAMYIDSSGVAWFGGNEGLYRYDFSKDTKDYNQKFNCLIRKVTTSRDSLLFGGNAGLSPAGFQNLADLKYQYNSIKFEFAAPFFDNEERTLYSYQLEGYDTAWSAFSIRTDKEYTNLSEGTYTFRVKAKNIYDVVSSTGTYTFTISPPWYRDWWAFVLYILFFAGSVYLIVKLNTHRLIAQKKNLEQIVKERTAKIENQKEEIQSQAEELKTINEKLVELDHFKEGLTGMIVHDLKNPLNTILSLAKIPELQQAGKQMLNMVLNILDVQKFENAQIKLQAVDFDFYSCLNDALEQTKFLFERKSIRIINNIKPYCIVKGDYELIQRVCVNLLSNAIKYTPNNGTISIDKHQDLTNPQNLKFSFVDTGSGIPEDKLHLIFDKFVQVEVKASGGVRSTGLGLTFCKMTIEAHGGDIGVESTIGKGSQFWFTLPGGIVTQPQITIPVVEISQIERFSLTEKEKQYLIPFIVNLANFTVYEFSDVKNIIETIETDHFPNINIWKMKLKNALKSCNEDEYNKLLKLN